MKPTFRSRGRGTRANELAPMEPWKCTSPDVAAILRRARGIGESSWRAGIALGVDPAALERIERGLDRLFLSAPR